MSQLDCIVVGHYEQPVSEILQAAEPLKSQSGMHRYVELTTCSVDGQRKRYSERINDILQQQGRAAAGLNVYRMPHLGACLLVSYLRKHDLKAEVINFVNHDKHAFIDLLGSHPRCVAITTTFHYKSGPIRHVVDLVRAHSPRTKVVVGGPHIFNVCKDDEEIQDYHFADMGADIYVHDSQGELTLAQLCHELRCHSPDLQRVPNLIWTEDGYSFNRTPRVPEDNEINTVSIDWSCFDPALLKPTSQLRTARSCAFKGAFCSFPEMAGPLTTVDLEVLDRELAYLHTIGVTQLMFIDDTFNIPPGRFKELCRLMISKRYGFRWFSQFRVGNADDEALDLAAASGCSGVLLGIESGDRSILQAMNKGATPERYQEGIHKLRDRGILSYASFIIGFPGETEQTALNTLNFIQDTQPDYYVLDPIFITLMSRSLVNPKSLASSTIVIPGRTIP